MWKLPSRINRIRYFNLVITCTIIPIILVGMIKFNLSFDSNPYLYLSPTASLIVSMPIIAIGFLAHILLRIKRLHDMNLDGRFLLITIFMLLIAFLIRKISFLFSNILIAIAASLELALIFIEGTKGKNQFGIMPSTNFLEYILSIFYLCGFILLLQKIL